MTPIDIDSDTDLEAVCPQTLAPEKDHFSVLVGTVETDDGRQFGTLVSRWSPTEEEREAIANGEDVYLHVLGMNHPGVFLTTEIEATPLETGGNPAGDGAPPPSRR